MNKEPGLPDRIRIEGMSFEGIVGELPHERTKVQPIEIDVVVELDLSEAGTSDNLADTVDYRWIYDTVAGRAAETKRSKPRLLESLLEGIAEDLLESIRIPAVTVRGRKPRAGLSGPARKIEVEVRRTRLNEGA